MLGRKAIFIAKMTGRPSTDKEIERNLSKVVEKKVWVI